jgi:hypothetical protein
MIAVVPMLSGDGAVLLHVHVSVPHIACLIDGKKQHRPSRPAANRDRELRLRRQKAAGFARATGGKTRAPSLRSLVKLALKCDSAKQMGRKLKQRSEKQQQRRGSPAP